MCALFLRYSRSRSQMLGSCFLFECWAIIFGMWEMRLWCVLCWCRPHGIFAKSKPVPATFTFCTFLFRVLEVLFTHASVPKLLACHMRACLAIFFLYFSRCSFLVRLFLMLIYFIVHIVCCFFLFSSLGCSNGISFGVLSTFLRCANHYNFWHSFHHVVSSISLSLFFVHVRECERARARLHITR